MIQACWNLNDPKTKKREVQGLLSALDELGLKHGTIVTWLDEDDLNDRIDIIPVWKWLLSDQKK
ncbi:MAG: hypothetical protein A2161_15375 [Candidatus Schekmanbacteria bacterium RBG_13_48_7]|uniref:Uncharacterized protein n=1 Tax=Candidatus Schekmanbacteria bacterium RBG_13_48_7 TaxID=1817878 RepID=A0A1F7S3X9_9BACT|nr:MAG: hypothetical protein A2161_15375 [Candidatus Schekmanbacteria bacterium RBG_13_48_7]